MKLEPLTSEQERKKRETKEAYESFWNHLKFSKGWAKPPCPLSEVEDLLDRVAEIVVRVRCHLDEEQPGFKLRMLSGRTGEYLWTLERHPQADPRGFVRDMVHETFCDGKGYVEGLDEQRLDALIEEVEAYLERRDRETRQQCKELEERLRQQVRRMNELVGQLDRLEGKEEREEEKEGGEEEGSGGGGVMLSYVKVLQGIVQGVENVNKQLEDMEERIAEEKKRCEQNLQRRKEYLEQKKRQEEEGAAAAAEAEEERQKKQEEKTETAQEETKGEEEEKKVMETTSSEELAESSNTSESAAKEEHSPMGVSAEIEENQTSLEEKKDCDKDEIPSEMETEKKQDENEGMLKIERVKQDVKQLEDQIAAFAHDTEAQLARLVGSNGDLSPSADATSSSIPATRQVVEQLQRQCLGYSESLMKDLLSLDALVGLSSEERPLRKEQVTKIQRLLQDVDALNSRLKALTQELKAKEPPTPPPSSEADEEEPQLPKEQKGTEMREEDKAKGMEAEAAAEREAMEELSSKGRKDRWAMMRLRPKFEVGEQRDSYVVAAYIPGMRKEDIAVSLSEDDTITIKGCRIPTEKEEQNMRRQVQLYQNQQRSSFLAYSDEGASEEALLLRLGAGRYGSFAETFRLPSSGVDTDNIQANYEGGMLTVVIPKIQLRKREKRLGGARDRAAAPQMQHPLFGFPMSGVGGRGGRGGFFGDSDFWW
ncbi:hypothetical protein QOT17_003954 [Balamuthia mandrillaris]